MALFERLASALFGGEKSADSQAERALVSDVLEEVVTAVEPRVKMDSSYRRKLDGCIRASIVHLRELGRAPLEPVTLARAAWASDPRVNAFFATADDVRSCLGRNPELRRFFDTAANAHLTEAYALLAMRKEERSVLGERDLAQTEISFSGHRIVAPAATLAAARLEIGRRILMRLAQIALGRIVAADEKATELEQHKAYLGARLRLLRLAQEGIEGMVKDPATIAQEMKAVQRELDDTVAGYIEAKASAATLDGYLQHIRDVFSHPAEHVALSQTPLRVSRLGVRVEGDASGPVNELELAELSLGADFRAAIAIVRCPRAEMPSKEDMIAQAERYL